MARTFARTPNSQEEFVKNLDPLLKRKRSSGVVFGENVNPGVFRLPGMGVNPEQLTSARSLPTFSERPYANYQPESPVTVAPENNQFPEYAEPEVTYQAKTQAGKTLEKIAKGESSAKPVVGGDGGYVVTQNDQLPLSDGTTKPLPDGGVLFTDGTIRYEDQGMYFDSNTGKQYYAPEPMIRLGDNYFIFRDGRLGQYTGDAYDRGLAGIQQAMFGQEYPVTQEYGNYNPSLEPGSGVNYGTDIGVINEPLVAPFYGKVVEVRTSQYPGAVLGDFSDANGGGWGNSVLLQLPSGEMFRFSHLKDQPSWGVGDVIQPGQLIGITGESGNATGEHLDLEYYNANGEHDNPNNYEGNLGGYTFMEVDMLPQEKQEEAQRQLDIINAPKSDSGQEELQNIGMTTAPLNPVYDPLSTQQDMPNVGVDSQTQYPSVYSDNNQMATQFEPSLMVEQTPGKKEGTVDLGATEALASLTGIQPEGEGKVDLNLLGLGSVNVPEYGVSEDVSSFIKNAIDKVGQTLQAATSVGTVYAETKGKNDGDFRNKTALPTQGGMSKLPTPDANTAAFTPARGKPATGQSGGEQGQVLGSQAERALSIDNQDNLGVGDMSPANQITQAQPERPLSAGEQRLNTLANQGKTPATSKKAAKISKRLSEIKQKYGVEGLTSSTATGYVNPLAEAKANIENKVKDVYYKSGLNNGSFDKFLQKTGNAGRDIVENAKGIVGDISRKAGQGVKDTRFTLGKAADAGLFSPKSAAYKTLQFGEKLQKGAENVKKQATAAGQIVSGKTQPELSSYIAPLLSRSAVKNMTVFERKLKKIFGR